MSVREIGPYVLLHRLAEDALSETYRAGLKSGDDVERVVLVCFFKAGQEDVDWIAETAAVGRRALTGLKSPQLADIVDSGKADGTAFLAYDYISGVSLSRLMEASRREGMVVPLELAILVAHGAAKGLFAAWQHESRMLHGFLVPPLVMLSSEGEVRLLGFEVASRLRRLLEDQQVRHELGPYLAPEVVPEGQPATTDDVYSLGAMLFELATGTQPPIGPADVEEAVATATLADGSELPEEIRDLLVAGLAPTLRRSNLQGWSEKLSEIVLSGRYEATSFNLAFFLHRLFGDELEDEPQRPAASQDVSADILAGAAAALEDETALSDTPNHEQEHRASSQDELPREELPREVEAAAAIESPAPLAAPRTRFAIAASIVVLVLAATGTAYLVSATGSAGDQTAALTAPVTSSPSSAALTQPPMTKLPAQSEAGAIAPDPNADTSRQQKPPEKTPEQKAPQKKAVTQPAQPPAVDVDRRVQELAAEQSTAMEASLRGQTEDKIDELRTQSEEAQREPDEVIETEASEPGRGDSATEPPATGIELASLDTGLAGSEIFEEWSIPETDSMATIEPPQTEPAAQGTQPVASQPPTRPADSEALQEPSTLQAANTSETTRQESASSLTAGVQQSRTEPPAPASPPTQLGDLVSPGPGVKPPKLLQAVQPIYPMMARRLHREAVVALRVLVDETGKVIQFEQLGATAGLGFDEAAIKAAREMIWEPATKDGMQVKMWRPVRMAFQL